MQERVSIMGVWCGWKNLSIGITFRHHSASLVMPISDPRDRFFYSHHTAMKSTYYNYICTCINSLKYTSESSGQRSKRAAKLVGKHFQT